MPTEGTIFVDGERFAVKGSSWMDHEFGTTFLEKTQQGWDWLSLQLDDGTDLMAFRMRHADGSVDTQSSGTLVAKGSAPRRLMAGDFTLTPGRRWTSPASGGSYPVEWQVVVPGDSLQLAVTPVLDGQEIVGARTSVKSLGGGGRREGHACRTANRGAGLSRDDGVCGNGDGGNAEVRTGSRVPGSRFKVQGSEPRNPGTQETGNLLTTACGFNQAIEQRLKLARLDEVLGVPLHADAERVIAQFERLDYGILRDRAHDQAFADSVRRLVMAAVHRDVAAMDGQAQQRRQPGAGGRRAPRAPMRSAVSARGG